MARIDKIEYWFEEVRAALKRDESYRKLGAKIFEIYYAEKEKTIPFNILYSNTDTLLPALYSNTPRPVVQRRFKDADPIGKAACDASTRMLEYMYDSNIDEYETFDDAMLAATLDALLPGRGAIRVKYDMKEDAYGMLESEYACLDSIVWDRLLIGYAKKWSKVPWVAFEEFIDREEATRLFGEEIADKLQYTKGEEDGNPDSEKRLESEQKGGIKTVCIYQIWDKTSRKVRWTCEQYKEDFLKVDDDPLGLTGFFPVPKPIQFIEKSDSITPTALYSIYESQAEELNVLTRRITLLARAIRAKGIYDGELGEDIKNLLEGDDNEFIAAEKSSALAAERGFQNAIWFMPIDMMVGVLNNLYTAREQCKQTIYEIMGVSDIWRGATDPNETASAQSIKNQWGSMRLRRSQKMVQIFARDLSRIMLEIAISKFDMQTWMSVTGLNYQPEEWMQVMQVLKNDLARSYRVDIETNSTILTEASEDRGAMTEALTAIGGYLKEVTPLVQAGALPFEAAKSILMTIVRKFQFGVEVEEEIDSMQAPAPPQPAPPPPDHAIEEMDFKLKLNAQNLESERLIAQGKAKTEIHIAELNNKVKVLLAKMSGAMAPSDLAELDDLMSGLIQRVDNLERPLEPIVYPESTELGEDGNANIQL